MSKLSDVFLGKSLNPLNPNTRRNIALIAFLAWIGLGSDGLSSANYGPEEAFRALAAAGIEHGFGAQHFVYLGLYLALATAMTVFVISMAYNQVIELFPNGGGGYKVANQLLHPIAGLVSGSALIIDYILTIAISMAAATDAIFSLLPQHYVDGKLLTNYYSHDKLLAEIGAVLFLTWLNIRGMKESIKTLLPIFLGFVIIHFVLIVYGIGSHASALEGVMTDTVTQTRADVGHLGWFALFAIFVQAYSLGGGTYTGLEAVSNNVGNLAKPQVRTGKWTMYYMAISLSLIAGGIILLYLLYDIQAQEGMTYNAIVFQNILGSSKIAHTLLIVVLISEAGILFIGANTGFFGGPAVLANMAVDSWVPKRFRSLSTRLVKQNGIVLFGLGAILILLLTRGEVARLVILYSTNVFLTFSITLLGLCKHWLGQRRTGLVPHWWRRLLLAIFGFVLCSSILMVIMISKFDEGGWETVSVTALVIFTCYFIRQYYDRVKEYLDESDQLLTQDLPQDSSHPLPTNPALPTAVFFVSNHIGEGMHTLMWTERLFPDHFKNYVFVRTGVVDVESFGGDDALKTMQIEVGETLGYFVQYATQAGMPATSYASFGTDPVDELYHLAEKVAHDFPNCVFFAGNVISSKDSWVMRLLHNETALGLQRRLLFADKRMVILPMRLDVHLRPMVWLKKRWQALLVFLRD